MGRQKLEEDESREVNKPRSYKVRKHMVRRVALIPNAVSGKSLKVFKQGSDSVLGILAWQHIQVG